MTKLAMIFPGQGSQSIGMLAELATDFSCVENTFAEASAILGYDLWQLCQQGPEQQLNQTLYTQPAMLAAGVSAYRVWQDVDGLVPQMTAGHSLGEYSALVAAGALSFTEAVKLVAVRARLIQDTTPPGEGAMAAIVGLDDAAVQKVCEQAAEDQIVAPANYNSVGQVVIAGHSAAVERAIAIANDSGAKLARTIPVSAPCHCDLLKPAAEAFTEALANAKIETPSIPVLRNVDAQVHQHPDDIRQALQAQLFQPVQWVRTIQHLAQEGASTFIEPGPGRVLTGLSKRIDRSLKTYPIFDSASLQAAQQAVVATA